LREPPSSLARADAIVITRTEQVSAREVADLERAIERCAPGRPLLRARHATRRLRDEHARAAPVEALAGREVDLVSAIGNPEAFEASVRATGAIVRAHRMYPDHHAYRREDLDDLGSSARTARPLVTTAKDAVKLAPLGIAFLALEIELEIVEGRPVLEALLDALQTHEAAIALKLPRRLRGSSTGGGAHV
jgi:tetraacyldisaccharide 4'-kinase